MLWFHLQPAEHVVKRVWREMQRMEATAWSLLASCPDIADANPPRLVPPILFWTGFVALTTAGLASLAACLDWL